MKRISVALLLMLLSSTAHARGYSFSIGGHFVHLEAGRHCRSLSCVSWSDCGRAARIATMTTRQRPRPNIRAGKAGCRGARLPAGCGSGCGRARSACRCSTSLGAGSGAAVDAGSSACTGPRADRACSRHTGSCAGRAAGAGAPVKPTSVVQAQAPSTIGLAAANTQPVVKPDIAVGKPKEKATVEATVTDKAVDTPDWAKDWSPPPKDAAVPAKVVAHEDDSPAGDWQTGGKKGLVRIEKCGTALCGYLLNETTNATGETVLSNMKAKTGTQWAGDIYSRASGNTYYAKMTFKQPDTLRVEACAIGRFFCSGNDWTRVARSDEVATSRSLPASPKS